MADVFALQGSYSATPSTGTPSADPQVIAPINELMQLSNQLTGQVNLLADPAVSIPFGGIDGVNVLVIKAVGGKVTVRITSEDGVSQAIPVDSFLALTTYSKDILAVSVQRTPAVPTTVRYFLGQKA